MIHSTKNLDHVFAEFHGPQEVDSTSKKKNQATVLDFDNF